MILGNVSGENAAAVVAAWVAQFNSQTPGGEVIPPDFAVVRAAAIATINEQAGSQRSRYATNIPFQGDLYQLKEREAAAFSTDPAPIAVSYPILFAEAAARGLEPPVLAAEYLTNAATLPRVLAAIEAVRMGAITAIKSAASIAEIEAALVAVDW